MDNQGFLSLLYDLYIACLILASSFLILSVTLYFTLHIKDVMYKLSGKEKNDAIRELEDYYSASGNFAREEKKTIFSISGDLPSRTSGGLHLTPQLNTVTGGGSPSEPDLLVQSGQPIKSRMSFKIHKEKVYIHTEETID